MRGVAGNSSSSVVEMAVAPHPPTSAQGCNSLIIEIAQVESNSVSEGKVPKSDQRPQGDSDRDSRACFTSETKWVPIAQAWGSSPAVLRGPS